jgi:adenosylcobinamide-GDP ribazoletransferase
VHSDCLGGGRDKAHCLDIMRDSRIGSYGVVALIVTLGLWAAALQALGDSATLGMFLAVAVISRAGMVVALDVMPPARSDGLGHMAEGHSPVAFGVAIVLSVLCLLPMGWRGLAVALAMCTVGLAVAYKAKSRIGGQTGDVLGALQMTSETAGWVALAVLFQPAG